MDKKDLDTPVVMIDATKLAGNISRMQEKVDRAGIALRPHAKTHKTPEIAAMQLASGAVGITVAKLGEAEAMAAAGIRDILIAYPLVGAQKLERLVRLVKDKKNVIRVAVDSVEVAAGISAAALQAGEVIEVWLEIDPGYGRVGLQLGEALIAAAGSMLNLPGIRLTGVMTFAGQSYDAITDEELLQTVRKECAIAVEAAAALRVLGCPIEHISVGSTPASRFVSAMEGVTEIRPGTYVFGDLTQVKAKALQLEECALSVLVTVISRPTPERAVVDAGTKVFTVDGEDSPLGTGRGYVVGHPEVKVEWFNEEHGVLYLPPDERKISVGDKLEIVPVHCCAVVNNFDEISMIRENEFEHNLTVAARGKVR
ncbi:alanine racemase [Paenibacillus sp. 19GGS1-52]|uniref:alanine racemase n=1 Tax=Paenibacillus sp. 19GGS1-52 TaxID=2758563 RepID=UPI001EFB0DFD|nr:alanine racemase [Paenibacillus sp. 19GGS1-52]ULO09794.1 alanine racemase [Paenibacillus sp. 19GGS1-52]